MKMSMTNYDVLKEDFPIYLEKTLGLVTLACKHAGVSTNWYYMHRKSDPEFAKRCDEVENVVLDFVESSLYKQIEKGVPSSTIFFLKNRGKKRGYSEQNQLNLFVNGDNIDSLHNLPNDQQILDNYYNERKRGEEEKAKLQMVETQPSLTLEDT